MQFIRSPSVFTHLRKWISTVFAPRLHLKMNFYCIENHKYGNSILDFAWKLLKFHGAALLMHTMFFSRPRVPLPFCSASAYKHYEEVNEENMKTLKIYCPWRGFFSLFFRWEGWKHCEKCSQCNSLLHFAHNLLHGGEKKKLEEL